MKRQTSKALLVSAVLLVGAVLALPNAFPSDPVLQIGRADAAPVGPSAAAAVRDALEAADVEAERVASGEGLFLRFASADEREVAADHIAAALPDHVVAFASQARLPAWMTSLGLRPVSLGLDLRGGVYFLYEVGLDAVMQRLLDDHVRDLERALREAGIRHEARAVGDAVHVDVSSPADVGAARAIVDAANPALPSRLFDVRAQRLEDVSRLVLTLREDAVEQRRARVMEQNVLTLRNRIDELGLSEPVVTQSGANRIMIQVPGARDPAQIRRILGSTATIEWRLADTANDPYAAAASGRPPPGTILRAEPDGTPVLLSRDVIASGEHLNDAMFTYQEGAPVVSVSLDGTGAARMLDATRANLGRPLAVLLIEETRDAVDANGRIEHRTRREESVIFRGGIAGVFSSSFVLRGLSPGTAQELALLIRSGALAAPIYEVRHGSVGATLGADNIRSGRNALIVGFLAVMAFMGAYYGRLGWIANGALLANVILIVGLLSALRAALTLPGLAGIVLTVGMAVDANVLIFERIRESRAQGKADYAAIDEGYAKALSTIADANVTTLIAGAVLFMFGTGAIRGFAVTLSLGVLTSMFTSIVGTRVVVDALYRAPGRRSGRESRRPMR